MITERNRFGGLTRKSLQDFERRFDLKLPADYRAFLLDHNGGAPAPSTNKVPTTDVQWIYGIHNGANWASLAKRMQVFAGRIPLKTLPIANDSGGNIFLLSLRPDTYGEVWFWDHEKESEGDAQTYFDNIIKSASSFTSFLDGLFEFVDPNETEHERIIRTNNLEGIMNLIKSGHDIEVTDEYDRTLLENASIHNRLEIAEILLDNGAKMRNSLALARQNMEAFPTHGYEPLVRLLSTYNN